MRRRDALLSALALPLAGRSLSAQGSFPNRPVRVIVPFGAGGSNDHPARFYGERLAAVLGQQIVVENKPGASATLGGQMVATAAPDGYTLLCTPAASIVITPHTRKLPYEPLELAPIARLSAAALTIIVTNELGVSTMAEFIALAKQNPGKFFFGSSGIGTITHLTGEVFARSTGIKLQHSPYKTIVDAVGDITTGRIHMVLDPFLVPQVKAGKVRALGTMARQRLPELPDVPTFAELGIDLMGARGDSWFGMFAPKGTDEAIVQRLSDEFGKIARLPEITQRLVMVGQSVDFADAATFRADIARESRFYAGLIKELDLKLE